MNIEKSKAKTIITNLDKRKTNEKNDLKSNLSYFIKKRILKENKLLIISNILMFHLLLDLTAESTSTVLNL